MGVIRDRLQQIIKNNNNIHYGDTVGEITYYDNVKNTASVKFANPNNGEIMTADNVTFKTNWGGLTQATPVVGQKCWISFITNSVLCPIITNLYDDLYYNNVYSKKTNSDQGAYIIDSNINDLDIESIQITPMVNDYFNDSIMDKYSTPIGDYVNTDAMLTVRKMLMEIDKYKASEDGITNIKNNSTVKFKDNGDIDIFVDNNTGIRISPNSKSIELYGTFKINGKVVGN